MAVFLSACPNNGPQAAWKKENQEKSNIKSVDIFYKTYKNDRQFLILSLKTVDRFAKGFRKVVIVTDADDDLSPEDVRLKNFPVELYKEQLPANWGRQEKYNHQQYVKLNFKKWTDADAILSIDSDVILYDLLTPGMYFSKDGKPVWLYGSYEDIMKGQVEGVQKALMEWRAVVANVLGKKPEDIQYEFMRFPGFLITRKLADGFESFVHQRFHKTLFEFLLTPSVAESGKHTEFNYLGAYAYYIDPHHEYDFRTYPEAASKDAKINAQIPLAIENHFPTAGRPYPLIRYHSYTEDPSKISKHSSLLLARYGLHDFLHQPAQPYLLVGMRGTTGLANRIKSVVSGLTMAKLSGRKLCLAWDVNTDMPTEFHDLFENNICMLYNFRVYKNKFLFNFNYEKLDLYSPEILSKGTDVLMVDSWKSFSDTQLNFKDYLSLYVHELKSLRPTPEMSARVRDFVEHYFAHKRIVGVHFRAWSAAVGDTEWGLKSDPIELFFVKMDEELAKHPNTKFFIATDDQANKERFIERYKDKVILSGIPEISRNSINAQKDGFFEWLLLGKTEFIIGTNVSTYSDEAALLTRSQRKINVGPVPQQFKSHDPLICFDDISGKPIRCHR